MSDKRIIHVSSIDEAASMIRRDFKSDFPVTIRGIITSLDGVIDLSKSRKRIPFLVKEPHQILRDGTELDYELNFGITKVDEWGGRGNSLAFFYARNAIKSYAKIGLGATKEQIKNLAPAILVYDKSKLEEHPFISYAVHLPKNSTDRSKAILAMYINNTTVSD